MPINRDNKKYDGLRLSLGIASVFDLPKETNPLHPGFMDFEQF